MFGEYCDRSLNNLAVTRYSLIGDGVVRSYFEQCRAILYLGTEEEYLRALAVTSGRAASRRSWLSLRSARRVDMGDLMSLASVGFVMIESILTVERTLASVFSFTASALKYFSPFQHVDGAK